MSVLYKMCDVSSKLSKKFKKLILCWILFDNSAVYEVMTKYTAKWDKPQK